MPQVKTLTDGRAPVVANGNDWTLHTCDMIGTSQQKSMLLSPYLRDPEQRQWNPLVLCIGMRSHRWVWTNDQDRECPSKLLGTVV